MTVVVKRQDEVLVFVKGADTSISALLAPNQKYLRFVEEKTREMARTGLRSLWFAYKHLPYNAVIDEMGVEEIE
jgi:magnesium-transporting ATPase (P-type)